MLTFPAELCTCLIFVRVSIYTHTLHMRATKSLASLRICTGSPEPSSLGIAISTKISCAVFFFQFLINFKSISAKLWKASLYIKKYARNKLLYNAENVLDTKAPLSIILRNNSTTTLYITLCYIVIFSPSF